MSYTPISVDVYLAAYSGLLAGAGVGGRFISSNLAADYSHVNKIADAFGQEFDTLYNKSAPTSFQIEEIALASEEFWTNRLPAMPQVTPIIIGVTPNPGVYLPSTYQADCLAIIAMLTQADAQIASQGIISPTPATGGSSGNVRSVIGANSLETLIPTTSISVTADGYYNPGDGGGGTFYYDLTTVSTDNRGTIIRPIGATIGAWIRLAPDDTVYASWFGCLGRNQFTSDIAADAFASTNAIAIQRAIDLKAGIVELPDQNDIFVDRTILQKPGVTLKGASYEWFTVPRRNFGSWLRVSTTFPKGDTVLKFLDCIQSNMSTIGIDGMDINNVFRAGVGIDLTADGLGIGTTFDCDLSHFQVRGVHTQSSTFTVIIANPGTILFPNGNPFKNNNQVYLSTTGVIPAGLIVGTLISGTQYFVINRTANSCQLSLTASGAAVNITGAGVGVQTITGLGYGVHAGGYDTGLQVSDCTIRIFGINECSICAYVDGSSGTTNVNWSNGQLIIQGDAGLVHDTGETTFDTVAMEGGSNGVAPHIVIRPAAIFNRFINGFHESFGEKIIYWVPGNRSGFTQLIGMHFQFTNGGIGNDAICDLQQDCPVTLECCQFILANPPADTGFFKLTGAGGGNTAVVTDIGSQYLNKADVQILTTAVTYIAVGSQSPGATAPPTNYGPMISLYNAGLYMGSCNPPPLAQPSGGAPYYYRTDAAPILSGYHWGSGILPHTDVMFLNNSGELSPSSAIIMPGANPAGAGFLRVPNAVDGSGLAQVIVGRNAANTLDIPIIATDGPGGNRYWIANSGITNRAQWSAASAFGIVCGGAFQFQANATGLGFYQTAPIAQPQVTNNTTGVAANQLVDVGAVPTQANINNNFATIVAKLQAAGLWKN